jgi:DNA-binding GntR family transcriptional regulator
MPSSDNRARRAINPASANFSIVLNAADMAYNAIKSQMLTGRLSPGEAFSERSLATRVGVSRTPLREALFRLERDRLVERNARGIVQVVRLSARDVQDIYACRGELDTLAVRLVVDRAPDEQLAGLRQLAEQGAVAIDEGVVDEVLAANDAFNTALYDAAANPWIVAAIEPLLGQLDRIQHVIAHFGGPKALIEGRLGIVAALEARDATAAENAVRQTIDAELDAVKRHLDAIVTKSAGSKGS